MDEHSKFAAVSLRKGKFMTVQEDRYTFRDDIMDAPYNAYYAVLDGHAGSQASQFCRDFLG
jgi:serine/threonine protein phosphatase PrpC